MSGSTLQERAIASAREAMREGTIGELRRRWRSSDTLLGGNEHVSFDESTRRDVIAFLIIHWMDMTDVGYVYGGFVTAIFSGKPWSDLDVCNEGNDAKQWCKSVVRFLCFCLDIDKQNIRLQRKQGSYSQRIELDIEYNAHERVVVKIDLSSRALAVRNERHFLPVTLGLCLRLKHGNVTWRVDPSHTPFFHWEVADILKCLRSGRDVSVALSCTSETYRRYYWIRTERLRKRGWHIALTGANSPLPYDTQELDAFLISEENQR